ncbi:L-methionine gamma-lyase-like [Lineus longissimus]|uniref:L-methionine gamma-lyase-like n=1 Tax=Lineus longissimus TaxID=88925 RepID=UPI002B4F6299
MSVHWNPPKSELDVKANGLSPEDVEVDSLAIASSRLHVTRTDCEPLTTPIYHSSTYKTISIDQYLGVLQNGGYIYSRLGNPTCEAAECSINALEGGAGSIVFTSGMAAITTTLIGLLSAGDHVVICEPVYSGTLVFAKGTLLRLGIEVSFIEANNVKEYREAIKPNTKLLYAEVPRNPTIDVLDLEEFGKLGKDHPNLVTFVDCTFASPYLQQPIKYGIDISMHSCTKYLGGHSDLLGGCLTLRTVELWKKIKVIAVTMGATLSPWDASLLIRGIKTLPIRMQRISSTALKLATFLEKHPKIARVHYPGLPSDPSHEIAKRQMSPKGFGGMISFEIKGGIEAGKTLVEGVKLIHLAVSLGGVESLIEHPATMTHGSMVMSDEERRTGRITPGLIRFSVGLEDPDDLQKDLAQALSKVKSD